MGYSTLCPPQAGRALVQARARASRTRTSLAGGEGHSQVQPPDLRPGPLETAPHDQAAPTHHRCWTKTQGARGRAGLGALPVHCPLHQHRCPGHPQSSSGSCPNMPLLCLLRGLLRPPASPLDHTRSQSTRRQALLTALPGPGHPNMPPCPSPPPALSQVHRALSPPRACAGPSCCLEQPSTRAQHGPPPCSCLPSSLTPTALPVQACARCPWAGPQPSTFPATRCPAQHLSSRTLPRRGDSSWRGPAPAPLQPGPWAGRWRGWEGPGGLASPSPRWAEASH